MGGTHPDPDRLSIEGNRHGQLGLAVRNRATNRPPDHWARARVFKQLTAANSTGLHGWGATGIGKTDRTQSQVLGYTPL